MAASTEAGRLSIRVLPDTSRFRADLSKALKRVENTTAVKVDAQLAEKASSDLQAQLLKLRDLKVPVTATLDEDEVRRRFKELTDGLTTTINADADTGVARAKLAGVARPRTVDLKARLDTSSVVSALAALSGARVLNDTVTRLGESFKNLDRSAPRIAGLATAFMGVTAAAGASLSSISGYAVSIAQLSGAALTLPAVMTAGAAGVAVLGMAMKDVKDVLGDLGPGFTALQDSVSGAFWEKAAAPIREMVTSLMPQLQTGLSSIAATMGTGWGEFATTLQDSLSVGPVLENVNRMFSNMNRSVPAVTGALVALTEVGAKHLPAMGDSISNVGEKFAGWVTTARRTGQLDGLIKSSAQAFRDLGSVVGAVGGIVGGVFHAGVDASASSLGTLALVLGRVSDAVNSVSGQAALRDFFVASREAVSAMLPGLGALGQAVATVMPAINAAMVSAGGAIGDALTGIATALSQPAISTGLTNLLTGVQQAVAGLLPAMVPVGTAIGSLMSLIGTTAGRLGGVLGAALGAVAPVVTALAVALEPVVRLLGDGLMLVIQNLQPAFTALAGAIGPVGQILMAALGPAVDFVVAGVRALAPFITGLVTSFGSFAQALVPVAETMMAQLAPAFQQLLPVISQLASALLPAFQQIFAALLPVIQQVAPVIVQLVEQGLSVMAQVIQAIIPIIPSLVDAFIGILNAVLPLVPQLAELATSLFPLLLQVVQAIAPVIPTLVEAFVGVLNAVTPLIPPLIQLVKDLMPVLLQVFQAVVPVIPLVVDVLRILADIISNVVVPVINDLLPVVKTVFEALGPIVTAAVEVIKGVLNILIGLLKGDFSQVWEGVKQVISGAWEGIKAIVSGAVEVVKSIMSAAWEVVKTVASAAWEWIKNTVSDAWNGIVGFVRDGISNMSNAVSSGLNSVKSFFTDMAGNVVNTLSNLAGQMVSVGSDIVGGIINGVKGAAGALFGSLRDLASGALNAAENALGINSPSRVMAAQVGKWIPAGIAVGMQGNAKTVTKATQQLTDGVTKTFLANASLNKANVLNGLQDRLSQIRSEAQAVRAGVAGVRVKTLTPPKAPTNGSAKQWDAYRTALARYNAEATKNKNNAAVKGSAAARLKALDAEATRVRDLMTRVRHGDAREAAYAGAENFIRAYVADSARALQVLAVKRDQLTGQLKSAKDRLKTQVEDWTKYRDSLRGRLAGAFDLGTLTQQTGRGLDMTGILATAKESLSKVQVFGSRLSQLAQRGLNKGLLDQLAQMDPRAGADMALNILKGSKSQLAQLNTIYGQIDRMNSIVSDGFTNTMFKAGIDSTRGLIRGIESQLKAIDAVSARLASRLVNGVRSRLGIHSPSRVMAREVGRWVLPGVAAGIDQTNGAYQSSLDAALAYVPPVPQITPPTAYDLPTDGPQGAGGGRSLTDADIEALAATLSFTFRINDREVARAAATGGPKIGRP